MLFNTFDFLVFFLVVLILYYTVPARFTVFLLLIASCIFYSYFIPQYLVILFAIIIIDFFAAKCIIKYPNRKRFFLLLSIFSNLSILFFFKYYTYVVSGVNDMFGTNWVLLNLVLPVGLSFHTFQSLSYVLEVYNNRFYAEKRFPLFALYVMYFPQLVAGPIEPPQKLLPEFYKERKFDWGNVLFGLRLILWGLFKKVVIADRVSFYVNGVFNHPSTANSSQVYLAVFFFTIQIYSDFSGYSDMAAGISRCMGIRLSFNFQRPFFSKNIQEFWRRWHVSLSQWFKNYIYIPLGGNQVSFSRQVFIIVLIFFLSGIWHGAGINYIYWGLSNAILIIIYLIFTKNRAAAKTTNLRSGFITGFFTFFCITITFIFFRAESIHQIKELFSKLLFMSDKFNITGSFEGFLYGYMNLCFIAASILFMLILEYFVTPDLSFFESRPELDVTFFTVIVCSILFTGVFYKQNFIYFQF